MEIVYTFERGIYQSFSDQYFYTMSTIFEQESILAKLNALNKKKHIYFEYKYIKIKLSKKETAKEQN